MMKKLHHRSLNETLVGANGIRPYYKASTLHYAEGNHHE
jgi:hypothetical protein